MPNDRIRDVLERVGVSEENINHLFAEEAPEGFEVDSVVSESQAHFDTQLRNSTDFWDSLDIENVNETFRKKVEAQQYGRASKITRDKLYKGLGFSEDDFSDLPEEDRKRLEVLVPKIAEKFAQSKVGDKELQTQLQESRALAEEWEQKYNGQADELNTQFNERLTNEKLDFIMLAELNAIQGLKVPANYIIDRLSQELKGDYSFVVDGFVANPRQKDNSNLKVLDGSKELGLRDLILQKLNRDKLIEVRQPEETSQEPFSFTVEGKDGAFKIPTDLANAIQEHGNEPLK